MVADANEILNTPILGDAVRSRMALLPKVEQFFTADSILCINIARHETMKPLLLLSRYLSYPRYGYDFCISSEMYGVFYSESTSCSANLITLRVSIIATEKHARKFMNKSDARCLLKCSPHFCDFQIKSDVENGIERLLQLSSEDPFRSFPARWLYRTVNNETAPSPAKLP